MQGVLWALKVLAVCAINTLLIIILTDCWIVGVLRPRLALRTRRESFLVQAPNRIDLQEGLQCSGYACAYLLRHFGREAQGPALYDEMPCRDASGCVRPKGLVQLLRGKGLSVRLCAGTLAALKNAVARGAPVIVMLKVRPDKPWLHYVPVVGYDAEHIYLAESLPECVNAAQPKYNRVLKSAQFCALWNTSALKMPLHRNLFFVAEPRKNA